MSVLRKLFGPKMSEEDLAASARSFVDEVEALRARDPEAAMQTVRRRSRLYQGVFRGGGELHDRFRDLVRGLLCFGDEAPSVCEIECEGLGQLRDVLEQARSSEAEVVKLVSSDPRLEADVVSEIEAECAFVADPALAVVVVGEGPPILARASFVSAAGQSLDPSTDILDLGQALVDHARSSGLGVRFL